MLTEIITLYPDNPPPEPPGAARFRLQQAVEAVDYEWKLNMSKMYQQTLPIIVPAWYSRKHTMKHAYGKHPQPVDTVADVRKQLDRRYRRLGLVAAADRADVAERIEWSNAA